MNRGSLSKLKLASAVILFLFIFQEILVPTYIAEPYPALRMPPFYGNNMNDEGFYETSSLSIEIDFEDQDSLLLSPREFFFDAPVSHHWTLSRKFKPVDERKETATYSQIDFLKPIFPGFFASRGQSVYERQRHPETIAWLRNHINKISDGKSPNRISFYWYQDIYDPQNLLDRQRQLTDTTIILL